MKELYQCIISQTDATLAQMDLPTQKLFLTQLVIAMCRVADHLRVNIGDLACMVIDYPYEFVQDQNIYPKKGEN